MKVSTCQPNALYKLVIPADALFCVVIEPRWLHKSSLRDQVAARHIRSLMSVVKKSTSSSHSYLPVVHEYASSALFMTLMLVAYHARIS